MQGIGNSLEGSRHQQVTVNSSEAEKHLNYFKLMEFATLQDICDCQWAQIKCFLFRTLSLSPTSKFEKVSFYGNTVPIAPVPEYIISIFIIIPEHTPYGFRRFIHYNNIPQLTARSVLGQSSQVDIHKDLLAV